jgi:uncharacterized integral membrane protein (TIGR00697 family)
MLRTRKQIIFTVLSGVFITSAIVAELISCKEVDIGLYPVIAGIVPWPFVFLLTDVMNEYYGKDAVRKLSWITASMIAFCFMIVWIAVQLPFSKTSYATSAEFNKIFGGSLPIMVGSITAFLVSQYVDVWSFWFMRKMTGDKMIWLRSTGSTVISQLVDSFLVLFIGFYLSGKKSFDEILFYCGTGYVSKLVIAVCLTPLIYITHFFIRKLLGDEEAGKMKQHAAEEVLHLNKRKN